MDTSIPTVTLLNTPVCTLALEQAAAQAVAYARLGIRPHAVGLTDVHVLTRARHEERFRNAFHRFDFVCPDGMPLVWDINAQVQESQKLPGRVSGAELMDSVIHLGTAGQELSHFFLGGSGALLADVHRVFQEKYPGVKIAGTYSPPFGQWPDDETQKIADLIRSSGAHCVWVGLGCPKQELWIGENLETLPPAVYFSVGAAFAFHGGHVKRAPSLFQKLGLEWLYRVMMEPKRLWKRYATYIPLYCYYRLRHQMTDL
jgi:N-acetylglucosaminyldiphosphoundecaprenol N-acetyl-beta-D-mannosaminyltransferase